MHYAITVNGKLLIASFCEELYISSVGRRTMLLRFIFLKAYSLSAEEPWAFPLHSGPKTQSEYSVGSHQVLLGFFQVCQLWGWCANERRKNLPHAQKFPSIALQALSVRLVMFFV
jgi:hypothetical protein